MADGRLAKSASLAGVATLASRVLGLARESVQAALFGAGNDLDAFLIAYRIPNLMRDFLAEGTMSAAFIPTFTRALAVDGKPRAWRLANNVLATLIGVTALLVILGMLFAGPLVRMYAGDYAAVPGKLETTIELTRTMLPYMMLVAMAAAMMGMLNALHHYFVPALSPAMFNICSIASMATLVPVMTRIGQPGIMALAIGVILGGAAQVALQWVLLRREGFRFRPFVDLKDEGLRHILVLMGPGTVGLAATQVNLFVNSLLATGEGTGAVSWLTYAFRLMYLPIGLFGVSIATAVLPRAARHAAVGEHREMGSIVSRGLGLMLAVNIPAMLGLLVLADPIIRVIFERGRFTAADTAATASALRYYAIGLVGYAAARIVSPVFYAMGKSRIPVTVSVVAIGVNIVSGLIFVRLLGFRGLAFSTALAALLNGTVLVWMIRAPLQGLDEVRLVSTFFKACVAGVAMAGVAYGTEHWLTGLSGLTGLTGAAGRDGFLFQAGCLAAAIMAGLATLAAAGRLLRIHEFEEIFALVRNRVGGGDAPA